MFDETLYAAVLALSAVQDTCVLDRLYHWEILQADESFDAYPCIAYNLLTDTPFAELNGVAGIRVAQFTFACYSRNTADVRSLAAAIQSLGNNPTAITGLLYILVEDTTDTFEPPIDMDQKGMKAAELTVHAVYRG